MADYWVRSGASGANNGASWTDAFQSWDVAACVTALATHGNRFFVADDHVDPGDGAAKTHSAPQNPGAGIVIISADHTDSGSVPAYMPGTTAQFNTTDGAYNLTLDGTAVVYGCRFESGATLACSSDADERGIYIDCYLKTTTALSVTGCWVLGGTIATFDGSDNSSNLINLSSYARIDGAAFVNVGYRTGVIFNNPQGECVGLDLSGFNNATECELANDPAGAPSAAFINCKTKSSPVYFSSSALTRYGITEFFNVGASNDPTIYAKREATGDVLSTTSIYRTNGGSIEGTSCAYLMTTTANCAENRPLTSPWLWANVSSTGSKTFSVHITNDTADFDNSQVNLEVQYFGTSGSAQFAIASDRRSDPTESATTSPGSVSRDDTTSTWIGLNDSGQGLADFMQKLSVTATVNQTGLYRARVRVGVASIASSRYFYIDPRVIVT